MPSSTIKPYRQTKFKPHIETHWREGEITLSFKRLMDILLSPGDRDGENQL